MLESDFAPNAPGRLTRAGDGYLTFEPDPLPPQIAYDREFAALLSRADLALGQLNMAGRVIPNAHLWIRPFIRREAVLSSRIEGTVTRLDQLLLFEADSDQGPGEDMAEVVNYVEALQYGIEQIRGGMPH